VPEVLAVCSEVALGHDFQLDQPYCHIFDLVRIGGLQEKDARVKLLVRRCWQLINDSCKTTLWLQFSAKKLAVALFLLSAQYSAMRINPGPFIEYYNSETSSDHRSELKVIWSQIKQEYDPSCKIHQHVNFAV